MNATLLTVAAAIVLGPLAVASQEADRTIYTRDDGVELPKVMREVKPQYTPSAMQKRVQGAVHLACVVETDGTVGDARVTKPLHAELDQQALKAAKQWRFNPGTKDGKPVRVRVEIEMTFTLRNRPRDNGGKGGHGENDRHGDTEITE